MPSQRTLRFALVLSPLLVAGCDLDGLNHRCTVTYEIHWDQKVDDMHFVHEDPRYCPIPIPVADGIQNHVVFGGTAVDTYANEYGVFVRIDIRNSADEELTDILGMWYEAGDGHAYAEVEGTYEAATGEYTWTGNPNDHAEVALDIFKQSTGHADVAYAAVDLTVLYGHRHLSINGPEEIPISATCAYSAQATLDDQPRPNMTYAWTVDGNPVGSTSNANIQLHDPGWHQVAVDATDEHGYVNSHYQWVVASQTSPPCS